MKFVLSTLVFSVTKLLSFRHLSESCFFLSANLHRRSIFSNFLLDFMQNYLSELTKYTEKKFYSSQCFKNIDYFYFPIVKRLQNMQKMTR